MAQPLSLAALRNALSAERLQAYVLQSDADELESVARYLWNISLCAGLQPALHALEVTLRNHLYTHSERVVAARVRIAQGGCWLDSSPSLLERQEHEKVDAAKTELIRLQRPITPGRLISKLGFGFWVSLCKRPYEQGRQSGPAIWPGILSTAFQNLPRADRNRSYIFRALDPIRALRNRVSHHEPIWDHDLLTLHEQVVVAIAWMNGGMAQAVRQESTLPAEVNGGHQAYRALAERIVRP